jgi:EAL domain-containing protein (putative c-di-GMP-specific phosphodiesterase class I)
MPSLGRVLLSRAGREVREWLDRRGDAPDFFVSVNLSALQLTDATLPAHVAAVLDRNRLEPTRLLLEVTESALLLDVDGAAAVLGRLAGLGVRIALDDFGTGYSSLAHLHRFPVHVLKTDRSFVTGAAEGEGADDAREDEVPAAAGTTGMAALVAEIGASLGLVTVGEGVETAEQLELVRGLGYDLAQGFLLGRPGPLAALRPVLPDLDGGPLGPTPRSTDDHPVSYSP